MKYVFVVFSKYAVEAANSFFMTAIFVSSIILLNREVASRCGSYDDAVVQSADIPADITSPDMGYYMKQGNIGRKPESLSQIMMKRQLEKIRARNLSLDSNPSNVDSDDDRDEDFVPNSTDEPSSDEFSTDCETEKYSPQSHVVHSSIQQSQCDSVRNNVTDHIHEAVLAPRKKKKLARPCVFCEKISNKPSSPFSFETQN